MSPGPKSEISASPDGAITVTRQRPETTYAHSAAIACQCNSRNAPGCKRIETAAKLVDTGNWSTVCCLAVLAAPLHPFAFSRSNLKLGRSLMLGAILHRAAKPLLATK